MKRSLGAAACGIVTLLRIGSAQALTIEITENEPSLVGASVTFVASAPDAVGTVQYRWTVGDEAPSDFTAGQSQVTRSFDQAGHYQVSVTAKDESGGLGGETVTHIVHYPLTERRPTLSTSIVYDAARSRIYNVNQDNDSISSIDPLALSKVGELAVYGNPEALALAPNGKLWVLHKDDYAIAIVDPDKLQIERGFRLPYASQPVGLAMSPTGDAAYVTLMAVGKLLKLDPVTGEVRATLDVGPTPRGVSVTADGQSVLVTRFVSPLTGGEVVQVDAASMTVKSRYVLLPDSTTEDTDQKGRGLPNLLFSAAINPDGRTAWVPGDKSNIFRGFALEMKNLSQDNTVRPLVSILDLAQTTEDPTLRIDLDDRDLPSSVEFSPLGDMAFITVTGSNMIEVRDAYTRLNKTTLSQAGLTPRATVLGPMGRLFVQGSLSRSVSVFDLSTVLDWSDIHSVKVTDIPVVAQEKLPPDVLLGKQVFNNSSDGRMTKQGYLACITCHFDAGEDGRVYDFTSENEGFRNTISLKGHRGSGQGNLLWSGAFDEVQDFEQEIRHLFLGSGFIDDAELAQGTRAQALGDPKLGLSKELDALAAYLATLDRVDPSPFRNPDGSMTADAVAGQAIFGKLGCDFCHAGKDFTDSARGLLHDVGTIKPTSGTRGGMPLLGLDTPTLLGVWQTAPYLHDGSAATLRDVLTSQNTNDQHGFVSSLSAAELDQLVAYLQQIDGDQKPRRLPFEPELPAENGGVGGASGSGGGAGSGGAASATLGGAGAGSAAQPPSTPSGSCSLAMKPRSGWLLLGLLALGRRRRRSSRRGGR